MPTAAEMGLETGGNTKPDAGNGEGGEHKPVISPENGAQGTGEGSKATPDKGGEGEGAGNGSGAGDTEKRINDLMSNWQKETHRADTAEEQLETYKRTFGELPRDGQPARRPQHVDNETGDDDAPPALRQGWAPKSIEELQAGLADAAKYGARLALKDISQQNKARADAEAAVESFVGQVKSADPTFDDKAFFQYAAKYKFPLNSVQDLRAVYMNYVDFNRASKGAGQGGQGERKEPVNKPGAGGGEGTKVPFKQISQAHSSTDLIHDMLHNKK